MSVMAFAAASFGRSLDLSESLVTLVVIESVFFGALLACAAVCGRPQRWPVSVAGFVVSLGIAGSMIWWWINRDLEVRTLVVLSNTHGITTGDLLSLPMLLVAIAVLSLVLWGHRPSTRR